MLFVAVDDTNIGGGPPFKLSERHVPKSFCHVRVFFGH